MNKNIFSFLLFCLFFSSCKKSNDLLIQKPEPIDLYKDEFLPCNCQQEIKENVVSEYIKAEINGISVCADMKGNFGGPYDNILSHGNIIRSTGSTYYDNLAMIRYTQDSKFMMAIFLENSHALTKIYPYELPRPNPEVCEIGELQIQNQQKTTANMCSWCTTNDWHYYGSFFGNAVKLIVDKYENGFFEGHFSGNTRTGSGRIAIIKNGSFRIKLTERKADIIIP